MLHKVHEITTVNAVRMDEGVISSHYSYSVAKTWHIFCLNRKINKRSMRHLPHIYYGYRYHDTAGGAKTKGRSISVIN